jgi:hypothetical protein
MKLNTKQLVKYPLRFLLPIKILVVNGNANLNIKERIKQVNKSFS